MINESDRSRDFSKEMTKKYRDTHKKIRNCNEFDNSLNFAKVSMRKFNEAIDEIRRSEVKQFKETNQQNILERGSWLLLKRLENLAEK